jgi:TM2 domain-containing membrane protein YozV
MTSSSTGPICPICRSDTSYSTTECQVCGAALTTGNPASPHNSVNAGGYCGKCGSPLSAKYAPCSKCGHVKTTIGSPALPQSGALPSPYEKSTGITVVLALVLGLFGLCGIGHFYLNKISRGVVLLIIGIILSAIAWLSLGIGLVILLPFLAWTVYDAHNLTKYYNNFVSTNRRTPW